MTSRDRHALGSLLLLLALLTASCAHRPPARSGNVGYEALVDSMVDLKERPLAGRRILIDPGHGGVFRGVIGRDGFSEAESNLGVALYLRGLLEEAGGEVRLTRSSDRDFLTPADSSLAADLAARSAMARAWSPDVFLSLHHNSNAALDRDLNETQTYYPVGRDGADLDLARSIHAHLARNLGIRPAKILPGNFAVLRNAPADVPSVLGEPSMLSNPAVEARLRTAPKLELEAQAYFLGLLDFFAGGTPRWVRAGEEPVPSWTFDPGVSGPPLDPDSIRMSIDGAPALHRLAPGGRTVSWSPGPEHDDRDLVVELFGRNLAGRAAPTLRDTLRLGDGIGTLRVEITPDSTGRALVSWRHTDAVGHPLALALAGASEATRLGADGVLRPGPAGASEGGVIVAEDLAALLSSVELRDRTGSTRVLEADPLRHPTLPLARWLHLRGPAGPWRNRGETSPTPSPAPAFVAAPFGAPLWLEGPGRAPLFIPDGADGDAPAWPTLLPHLSGRTVVIDPGGGGGEDQGVGPLGTPGRELNLRLAERLAALLRGAGVDARLTRNGPEWVPPQAKVLLANRSGADLFLVLARGPREAPLLEHHHGSRNGTRWAELTAAALAPNGPGIAVEPSYAYLLRHTAPPALRCTLPLPLTAEAEAAAGRAADQQAAAWALFRAIDAYFGDEELTPGWDPALFISRHRTSFPHPDDLDYVRLDGNWLWLPPEGGPAAPVVETPFPRRLEVRAGERWWLWEADPSAGTLRRLLSGVGDRFDDPVLDEAPPRKVLHAPQAGHP